MRSIGMILAICSTLFIAACQSPLTQDVTAALENPDHTGIRWGLVVAEKDGSELLAFRADDRFTPASNTKIITTMASYHHLAELSAPALNPGTQVYLEPAADGGAPNLVLYGAGDAMLSDGPDCQDYCLTDLADAIVSTGLTEVEHIIGDDTFFAFERWGPGWSLEDLQYYYGTAVSALSLNDNLVWIDVTPGMVEGDPVQVAWQDGDAYLSIDNTLTTSAADDERALRIERYPGTKRVRLYGSVPAGMVPLKFGLALDDPAERTALRFAALLAERGLTSDAVSVKHRPLELSDEVPDPETETDQSRQQPSPSAPSGQLLATLSASPLRDSLRRISKDSENLHAEIALRRLGRLQGSGSRAFGVEVLEAFLEEAGIDETGYAVNGGSGMSIYNRISPRAMVRLLSFAAKQPWFKDWLEDQPIGGVDGSLKRRFKGTLLEGRIFAKTGTLNGANALSGVMIAASGRELLFSIIANDRPATTRSAIAEMDAALVRIAEAY